MILDETKYVKLLNEWNDIVLEVQKKLKYYAEKNEWLTSHFTKDSHSWALTYLEWFKEYESSVDSDLCLFGEYGGCDYSIREILEKEYSNNLSYFEEHIMSLKEDLTDEAIENKVKLKMEITDKHIAITPINWVFSFRNDFVSHVIADKQDEYSISKSDWSKIQDVMNWCGYYDLVDEHMYQYVDGYTGERKWKI